MAIKTFMDGDKPTDGCITTQGKFEHSFGFPRNPHDKEVTCSSAQ